MYISCATQLIFGQRNVFVASNPRRTEHQFRSGLIVRASVLSYSGDSHCPRKDRVRKQIPPCMHNSSDHAIRCLLALGIPFNALYRLLPRDCGFLNQLPGEGERSQRGIAHSLVKNAVSGLQTTYLKEKTCRICVQVLLIFLPRLHNPKTSLQPSLIYHMGSPQDPTLT